MLANDRSCVAELLIDASEGAGTSRGYEGTVVARRHSPVNILPRFLANGDRERAPVSRPEGGFVFREGCSRGNQAVLTLEGTPDVTSL